MPQGHESKYGQRIRHPTNLPDALPRPPTDRDVDVPNDPTIEAAVPSPPEREGGVIIAHAADDVFGGVDAVEEGPEAEEAEWNQELEPDDMEVEVTEHAELEGGVGVPGGGGGADGDGVDVVEEDFHAKEEEEEANCVEEGAVGGQGGRGVAGLGNVVVEGEDWAGEVEGRV